MMNWRDGEEKMRVNMKNLHWSKCKLAAKETRGVFMDWRDDAEIEATGRLLLHRAGARAVMGPRIAARFPSIRASAAGASTMAPALITFGPSRTKRHFSIPRQRICI